MKCLSSLALSVLLVAVAVEAAALVVDDATVQAQWNAFKSERGLKFANAAEEAQKKSNFAYHYQQMAAARLAASFELGPNEFFTEGADVFQRMTGFVVPPHHNNKQLSLGAPPNQKTTTTTTTKTTTTTSTTTKTTTTTTIASATYPGIQLNWASLGYVTPVKNQGQCGSCWAFSATGALEGQMFKFYNGTVPVTSLSEQNLVDCTYPIGCNGGWMATAWAQITNEGGIEGSVTYPYTAGNYTCRFNVNNSIADDSGTAYLPGGDEVALLSALQTVGPISVGIDASHTSFSAYRGGIYSEPLCATNQVINHAVLIVGYGSYNGVDYWLVKNSWGTTWGIKGYMMIARNAGNMCGIASYAMYPLL